MLVQRALDFRRLASAGLFVLTSMGWTGLANAQDHTADPYKPYNQQYEQFVYPSYPSGYGLTPNQNLLERGGYAGPNQFQRFLESDSTIGDDFGTGRRRTGPGVPYYSAYRQYDKDYGRIYQPNQESDRTFHEDQRSRHEKYMAYLKEKDPRKRAELYRAYTKDANKVSRDLATSRVRTGREPNPEASEATKIEARASSATSARRRSATPPSGAASGRSPLFGGTRETPKRPKSPTEILRESQELDSSNRLTAPGLAPRSGVSKPK
ncbi:hypothetical protein SAMN05444166_6970 [Singulisphaera sp. GP187]|uniref:hypothetical protein n=1 Tax=Singulisphaera sp. GP187 TaxID=1882752 RepID=UPI000929DCB3|nr:hypothetical protein [Singulisphaera sp. GP187]SIO62177.1 hypothetical protein SAMN05444166_6970 [Singulisphaera sp. GP187]